MRILLVAVFYSMHVPIKCSYNEEQKNGLNPLEHTNQSLEPENCDNPAKLTISGNIAKTTCIRVRTDLFKNNSSIQHPNASKQNKANVCAESGKEIKLRKCDSDNGPGNKINDYTSNRDNEKLPEINRQITIDSLQKGVSDRRENQECLVHENKQTHKQNIYITKIQAKQNYALSTKRQFAEHDTVDFSGASHSLAYSKRIKLDSDTFCDSHNYLQNHDVDDLKQNRSTSNIQMQTTHSNCEPIAFVAIKGEPYEAQEEQSKDTKVYQNLDVDTSKHQLEASKEDDATCSGTDTNSNKSQTCMSILSQEEQGLASKTSTHQYMNFEEFYRQNEGRSYGIYDDRVIYLHSYNCLESNEMLKNNVDTLLTELKTLDPYIKRSNFEKYLENKENVDLMKYETIYTCSRKEYYLIHEAWQNLIKLNVPKDFFKKCNR